MAQESAQDTAALTLVIEKLSEICRRGPNAVPMNMMPITTIKPQKTDPPPDNASVDIVESNGGKFTDQANTQTIYHCRQCGYTSHNKYYLRQHLDLVHNSTRPYKCPFCDYAGKRSYALKEHLIVHSSDRPHECVHCHATFRKKGHLSNHLKMHASQLVCALCKVTCRGKQQLLTHLHQQHSRPGEQVYACDQCLYASMDKNEMMSHLQRHTDPKQVWLKCSVCGFSCNTENVMHTHMLENHLDDDDEGKVQQDEEDDDKAMTSFYSCSACGYTCDDKAKMNVHIATHNTNVDSVEKTEVTPTESIGSDSGQFTFNTKSRMFACTICNYTCDQQRTIKSHIWKHSGHKDILYPMFEKGSAGPDKQMSSTMAMESSQSIECGQQQVESVVQVVEEKDMEPVTEVVIQESNEAESKKTAVIYAKPKAVKIAPKLVPVQDVKKTTEAVDIAQRAAILANIMPPTPPGVAPVASVTPPIDVVVKSGQRKRRASDSEISAKRLRVETTENTKREEKVVVLRNVTSDLSEILLAAENADNHVTDDVRSDVSETADNLTDEPEKSQPKAVAKPVPQPAIVTRSKRGICSSLLAVIEQQLQEKGETESNESTDARKTKPKPVTPSFAKSNTGETFRGDETPNSKENCAELGWDKNNLEQLNDGHYRCRLCHYQSLQFSLIAQHMKLHKIKRPFECSLCDYVAQNSLSLQEHMLQHCKVRTYQCKTCGATFNYKSQLRAHCRMHEEKNKVECFVCEWCDFVSGNVSTFRNHVKTHDVEVEVEVVNPDKSEPRAARPNSESTKQDALESNPETTKDNAEPISTVMVNPFNNLPTRATQPLVPSIVQNPMKIVPNPPLQTQLQAKSFEQLVPVLQKQHHHLQTLPQVHIPSVQPVQPVQPAPPLQQVFQQSQVQQILVTTQAEEDKTDQLQCTQCEFRAISIRSLKSHMKRHVNDQRFVEKPLEQYKCTMCGYVCHHLPSLKSHMWRHASDTTYSYNKANEVINAAIDRDVMTSDEDQEGVETFITFRCVVCGFESTDRSKLAVHMRQHQDVIDKTLEV